MNRLLRRGPNPADSLRALTLFLALVLALGGCAAEVAGEAEVSTRELALGDRGEEVVRLHDYLRGHGYFPSDELAERYPDWVPAVADGPAAHDVFDERTEEAVEIFQDRHDLEPTGFVDAETWSLMMQPQCGNPIHEHGADDDKWHHDGQWSSPFALGGTYTYRIIGRPPGWTTAQTQQTVRAAFDVWQQHMGIRFVEVTSGEQTHVRFTAIDGPGGTLGLTYNNYWGGSRNSIDIDTGEGWVAGGVPNMGWTLAHEIGHMLGFEHSGLGTAVMFPFSGTGSTAPVVLTDDDLGALTHRYRTWVTVPGGARDIGDGAIGTWLIGTNARGGGFGIWRRVGSGWTEVGGGAVRIAVGDEAWLVNDGGRIYRRLGTTASNPQGTSWQDVSGTTRARDIGVASGRRPWIIGTTSRGSGGFAILRHTGSSWVEVGGAATRVAVAQNGAVFVVNAQGQVFQRQGITASNPSGTSWLRLTNLAPNVWGNETGFATDVSATRTGVAWVVGTADGTPMSFLRNQQPGTTGGGPPAVALNRWIPIAIAGGAVGVASHMVHAPWIVRSTGAILQRQRGL